MSRNKSKPFFLILALSLSTALSGCGNVRESLGITKDAPDEFAVVRHAPLEMPTTLVLPPPRPGQPRPQEQTATTQAKDAIFGSAATTEFDEKASGVESALLKKTGAEQSDPNIRQTLDAESKEYEERNRPVAQKLLGLAGKKTENTAETLDPKAESERLKQKNLPTTEIPPEWDKDAVTKK